MKKGINGVCWRGVHVKAEEGGDKHVSLWGSCGEGQARRGVNGHVDG